MAPWFLTSREPLLLPLEQFLNRQYFEKCAKIVRIATLIKTPFLTVDCVSNHKNECHQVPRRKIWFHLHLFRSYGSNKVKSVNFIVTHSVASFDATRKISLFLASWCRELSNGMVLQR